MIAGKYTYEVAISFAEEDRNAALALSLAFEIEGFKSIYYYPEKQEDYLGEELEKILTNIYCREAKYAVILFSEHYLKKDFTRVELEAIKNRMKSESSHVYMIPVKLNDKFSFEDEDLAKLKCYLWNYNPKPLAKKMMELFGKRLTHSPQKAGPEKIIYYTGNQALFIVGGNIKNFKQKIFKGDGNR